MKRAWTLLGCAALCAAVATASASDYPRPQIEAGYKKIAQAMKTKNVAALKALATEDFTWREAGGDLHMPDSYWPMLEAQMATFGRIVKCDMRVAAIEYNGAGEALVTSRSVFKVEMRVPGSRRVSIVRSHQESKDHWVWTADGWKVKHVDSQWDNTTVDGKRWLPDAAAAESFTRER